MSASRDRADEIPVGTVLGDRFEVVGTLGKGGMGAVYAVIHTVTRHRRALKLLHRLLCDDRTTVDRFLREASAAGRIGHPNIVQTFDAGRLPDGTPYVLMELLEGRSLQDEIDAAPTGLPEPRATALLASAARAMHAAHEAGIVHRDLKPANLFVVGPTLKVLDFGISRFDERHTAIDPTSSTGILGTPAYLAPEQIEVGPRAVDARTDVHALGVILYECVAGARPYDGDSWASLFSRILTGSYTKLVERRADVSPALASVVDRAMRTRPDQRYPTALALAEALDAIFGGEARSPSANSEAPAAFDATVAIVTREPAVDATGETTAVPAAAPPTPTAPPPPRRLPWGGIALAAGILGVAAWGVLRPEPPPPTVSATPPSAAPAATPVISVAKEAAPPPQPPVLTVATTGASASSGPAASSSAPAPSSASSVPPPRPTSVPGPARPSAPTRPPPRPSSDLAGTQEWPG